MNRSGTLFNSRTESIPALRSELEIIPIQNNGDSYLYFYDQLGYATPDLALDRSIAFILTMLNGNKSVMDIHTAINSAASPDQILEFIRFLDENRLLYSSYFFETAEHIEEEYENSGIHKAKSAGISYPADPDELRAYLDQLFSNYAYDTNIHEENVKALFAPHIDPRVAPESYIKAFGTIRNLKPSRVIFLATAHHAGLFGKLYDNNPFIVSTKNFQMPLKTIQTDIEVVEELAELSGCGVTTQDRAHRMEHSTELHLLYLSYIWDHNYAIVPILVDGFDDLYYMKDGHLNSQVELLSNYLNQRFWNDDETIFLVSGDLCHVGKKFGDSRPASNYRDEVAAFDRLFLKYGKSADSESLLHLMKKEYDPYRVCGFSPLYTLLRTFPHLKGDILSYDIWDEKEQESAVTFGSILYHK